MRIVNGYIHWSGIDVYSFIAKDYCIKRIKQEDMDALKKLARMTAAAKSFLINS